MNLKLWESRSVTQIAAALYVKETVPTLRHIDRPFHGLVLNEPSGARRYEFDDGCVMNTGCDALFYLPKKSSYRVIRDMERPGSCWAINFDLDGEGIDKPFVMAFRDVEPIRRDFIEAARAWREKRPFWRERILAALYDIIARMAEESQRQYLPSDARSRIAPAEAILAERFTDHSLTIGELAAACEISEVYFRRLFGQVYGISPAAYIGRRRLEMAKELLFWGQMGTAETAEACGWGDPSCFCREFRRRTGVTPSQYRRFGKEK